MAPGLRDPVVPGGAEPSRVEVGGVPPDVRVTGGQLVHVQLPSVVGADCRVVVESDLGSGDRACPGPGRGYVFPERRQASALVHHQVSPVSWLVPQRVHRHVRVMWHLRSHQQGGAAGESTGPGLAFPHLHYHPLGPELRLLRCSGALVVRGHQPNWRRRMGPWAQRLGPRHIRVGCLVLTVREYVAEDAQEGRRRVVCRPLGKGGMGCPDGGSPRRGGSGRLRSPAG